MLIYGTEAQESSSKTEWGGGNPGRGVISLRQCYILFRESRRWCCPGKKCLQKEDLNKRGGSVVRANCSEKVALGAYISRSLKKRKMRFHRGG